MINDTGACRVHGQRLVDGACVVPRCWDGLAVSAGQVMVLDAGDVFYRGACVNEDAVDACLAAARCSVIDENELGGPATCGDAIAGRVYSV